LVICADPLIEVWTGGNVDSALPLVAAFLAGAMFAAPSQTNSMLLTLSNVPQPLAVSSLVQAILGVCLTLALVPVFGSLGAAVALGFSDAIALGVVASHAAMKQYRLPAWAFTKAAFGSELAGALLGGLAAAGLLALAPVHDAVSLSRFGVLWTGAVALPAFWIVFDSQQRRRLLDMVRQRLKISLRPSGSNRS
jgi:O-antigen/teichoic acid export membrane protein